MQNKESASAPNVLEAMRQTDVLLHRPYDSFSTSVQRFLEQGGRRPEGAGDQTERCTGPRATRRSSMP